MSVNLDILQTEKRDAILALAKLHGAVPPCQGGGGLFWLRYGFWGDTNTYASTETRRDRRRTNPPPDRIGLLLPNALATTS